MNAQFNWTEAAIIELKRCRDKGDSSRSIANELSEIFQQRCSRNSVIGKVFRLGLDKRPRQPKRIMIARAAAPRVARPNKKPFPRKNMGGHPWSPGTSLDPVFVDLSPDASECATPLIEARDGQCRWPQGEPTHDMLVCGADVAGHPYCARHNAIAYTPHTLRPRRRVTA